MKIEKFTKLKSGQYKLNLDNNTEVNLHEDLILKHKLLLTKEIKEDQIIEILKENQMYLAYDLALKYINYKMRSKKEIKEYLIKKEIDNNLIDEVITKLETQGYLNDSYYVKAYINDKINLSYDGPYKIKENLIKMGISEDIVLTNLELFDEKLEVERIKKLIDKQIKNNRNKSDYLLKQKIINNLVNLGYTKSLVISNMGDIKIDDSKLKQKEYDKIYKKLSQKYSGKELEYKIKQRLYQKGFFE